jgi:hypothetical protein
MKDYDDCKYVTRRAYTLHLRLSNHTVYYKCEKIANATLEAVNSHTHTHTHTALSPKAVK